MPTEDQKRKYDAATRGRGFNEGNPLIVNRSLYEAAKAAGYDVSVLAVSEPLKPYKDTD